LEVQKTTIINKARKKKPKKRKTKPPGPRRKR